jgi:hypothetical protein
MSNPDMQRTSRSYDLLWLSLALLPLIGLSFLFSIQPQDYWWYVRVGQETLLHAAVPITDTISLSQAGQPITYQPWLAGVIFWLVYDLGGIPLTFLLRAVLLGLTYGGIWFMLRNASGPRLATVLVVVMGLASANNWAMRTQLFGYPLFIGCLWILLHWQAGRNQFLWGLPLATLLWANLHGSFILPFILAGTAMVFGRGNRKPLALVILLMFLVTLVNPRGPGVWQYFAFMINSPSDHLFSVEWYPPANTGWQMNLFFGWMLAFAPLAALSPRKLSLLEWTWFLGFGWLALSGTRYVIWFLMIAAVLTAVLLAEWAVRFLDRPVKSTFPPINLALSAVFLLCPLLFLPGLRESWLPQSAPIYEMETTPVAATEWLAAHPDLPGPLWTDYAFGGYLSFALPARRPWMDSRFNAFPPEQWDEYVHVSKGEPLWPAFFEREGINLLMLSTIAQPKLVEAVEASPAWCEQYRDEYAVILARCEALP